jgi:pimeloyl-ACP methyl ester carboxylesterase
VSGAVRARWSPQRPVFPAIAEAARLEQGNAHSLLHIFFAPTESSRPLGTKFPRALHGPHQDRDPRSGLAARDAQHDAIVEWGIPDHGAQQRLEAIRSPTLIIQGDSDQMIPTRLSHVMAGLIPDARIHISPDAAHASFSSTRRRWPPT